MLRPFVGAIVGCILLVTPSSGQAPKDPKRDVPFCEARFHDGTVLRNVEIRQTVEIATEDGNVQVDADDVVRIDIGMRLTKDDAAAIANSIRKLGDKNYAIREAASKDLHRMGHRAYAALRQAAASKDAEVSKRAIDAACKIREAAPTESLVLNDHDVIYTRGRRVLCGQIEGSAIQVHSLVAGDMTKRSFKIEGQATCAIR